MSAVSLSDDSEIIKPKKISLYLSLHMSAHYEQLGL
jgi:hypothetical protein